MNQVVKVYATAVLCVTVLHVMKQKYSRHYSIMHLALTNATFVMGNCKLSGSNTVCIVMLTISNFCCYWLMCRLIQSCCVKFIFKKCISFSFDVACYMPVAITF